MLGLLQPIGRLQQRIHRCRQGLRVARRIKRNGACGLLGNLVVARCVACHHGQSRKQKVKYFVADGQVVVAAVASLAGKPDIVLSNTGEQLIIVHGRMHKNQLPPGRRHLLPKPRIEIRNRRAAQVNLRARMQMWKRSKKILQATPRA
jgi:hypothetical protein